MTDLEMKSSSTSNDGNGVIPTEVDSTRLHSWSNLSKLPFDTRTSLTVVSAIASVISALTACLALKTARDNFLADQRPVIWLTHDSGGPEFVTTQNQAVNTGQILWSWHFTNYGKTPALRVSFRHFLILGDTAERYGATGPSISAPLPTNQTYLATSVSRPAISRDEFDRVMKLDGYIGISGEIFYFDAYGTKYETSFCLKRLATGSFTFCKDGNDIKEAR
jgi:hypothetical protein